MISVVLDDDPTGTQAMSGVSIVLDWSDGAIGAATRDGDPSVHVLTNSRAHTAAEASALTASAARAARAAFPAGRVLLRGDSTLRGHVWEEYDAVRRTISPDATGVPLLLVPALPAAGRVTLAGVHLLDRDGARVPLHRTEYATDGDLAYGDARLARWAEERSDGRLAAGDAIEIPLTEVRAPGGGDAVAAGIRTAFARGRPAVVVPDAETDADLEIIARGLRAAETDTPVIARSSPAFAAILTGTTANGPAARPTGEGGVLLLCGSFVPTTTAQLEALSIAQPGIALEADVRGLVGDPGSGEVERLADAARELMSRRGVAVIATSRQRDPTLVDAASQRRVASALARIARLVPAGVVIAKGGITSAVTALEGLGARSARVVGPIAPGVSRWQIAGGPAYVVVPGNVGGPRLLVELVSSIVSGDAHVARV
jgi:uncharacterized protein YgbK (DUF1537 family)